MDVLRQLPMISADGNEITITGKGVPEILINGRLIRDTGELQRLQSADIKRVELALAPGAAYSGSTHAVLKIITRRNFLKGLSLTDRAEMAARRKFSISDMLDLNYHTGPYDVFATVTASRGNRLIKGSTTNALRINGHETVIGSSQNSTYPTNGGSVKAGFNYAAAQQSFGAYYRFSPETERLHNNGAEWLEPEPETMRRIDRATHSRRHLVSAYYDNTFHGSYLVHFDGDYFLTDSDGDISTTYTSAETAPVNASEHRSSSLLAGKLYCSFPLWQGHLTFGTQDSRTDTRLDYRMLNESVSEYIPSVRTTTGQTNAAIFASWDRNFGKVSLTAGLRYEYVDYDFFTTGNTDGHIPDKTHTITPDISIGWAPDDQTQISLSYRKSTLRPPYSRLTGALNYVGQHEIEGGNPELRDERMHDLQLFGMYKDFILQADYTRSEDTYGFIKRIYPANSVQLMLQPVNMNVSAADLYLIWSKHIGPWSPDFTIGLHKQWLRLDNDTYNRPIFSYNLGNVVSLPHGFTVTVNAHGQSRGDMHTNQFAATPLSMDASVSRFLLKKSIQIRLSATDILNTANNDWSMNTYGIRVDKRQSYDRRGISLSITYRFQPRRSEYKGKTASSAETDRL